MCCTCGVNSHVGAEFLHLVVDDVIYPEAGLQLCHQLTAAPGQRQSLGARLEVHLATVYLQDIFY